MPSFFIFSVIDLHFLLILLNQKPVSPIHFAVSK